METNWLPKHREKKTAESAVLARAAGAVEPDPAVRCPDFLAHYFLQDELCPHTPEEGRRLALYREECIPGIYFYHVARTKHCDRLLQVEARRNLAQFVVLGAGYDTRAYRFRSELQAARVFEVDLPTLQEEKRKKLANLTEPPPGNITYVSTDFTTQTLAGALVANGYDPAKRTFFLWEGVTFFLPASSVEAILTFVGSTAPGNSLAFDYLLREVLDGREYYGSAADMRYGEWIGEPYQFGIPEGMASQFLCRWALDVVSEMGPPDLENAYLIRSDGHLHGRVVGHLAIVHARVRGE